VSPFPGRAASRELRFSADLPAAPGHSPTRPEPAAGVRAIRSDDVPELRGVSALARTDAELIASSLADARAFATLFDRHHDAIAGYLRRRVDRSLGDELAAETFLQAFAARERYDLARSDARPWLYGIATNLLRRHYRSEERRLRAYARTAAPDGGDRPFDGVEGRLDATASRPAIAVALASLGPGERDVLLMYAWAELSYEQIADALGIPVGTVRSRLHRARGIVRERLEANGQEVNDGVPSAAGTGNDEMA
jgi:RNA polymerase sigma factor (sigma-70 family)